MKVSVIVPVRNEEQSIRALLDALLAQERIPDEIVITDGGSTDITIQIIEEYMKRGESIKLIRETAALPGRGRNLAVAQASFEWIAFIDAGIEPARDWLAMLMRRAELASADVVYGGWEPIIDTFFKECAAIASLAPPDKVDGALVRGRFIASCLMRREVWETAGGFPEHLRSAEDILFMDRIEEANFRVVREPRALVRWNIQHTTWLTFRRFLKYSRNNIKAGLWSRWQSAVFRRYGMLVLSALPALMLGPRWLAVTFALWLLLLGTRAVVALRRNAEIYPAGPGRNAARFLLLFPLIALLDAATIGGAIDYLFRDQLFARS